MNVDDASNRADDQADNQASDSADDQADDQTSDTMDNDGAPDTADMTDADVFETIVQGQTPRFPDLESTVPDPEQIPSADSESPSENENPSIPVEASSFETYHEVVASAELESPPEYQFNPVEASSSDAHPEVFVKRFPHGNPGAPIDNTQGPSVYESNQDAFGGSVWAPFQSKCDWDFAHWAKMNGSSASSLSGLLEIPNVRPFFFFITTFLNVA